MQTLKTAVVVVLLLVVFYGVYEMLNRPPDPPPEEVAAYENMPFDPPDVQFGEVMKAAPTEPAVAGAESAAPGELHSPVPPGTMGPLDSQFNPAGVAPIPADTADLTASHDAASESPLPVEPPVADAAANGKWPPPQPSTAPPPNGSIYTPPAPPTLSATGGDPRLQNNPFLRENVRVRPGDPATRSRDSEGARAYERSRKLAQQLLDEGKYHDALATLSVFYKSQDLTPEEHRALVDLLDPLAARVVYSREHLIEPAYVVRRNESLNEIAEHYRVPAELLQKINGIDNPEVLVPGTQLKVITGPFRADVDLPNQELTLFLNSLYAGRFPITVGQDPTPVPGEFAVRQKQIDRDYFSVDGHKIAAGDPANPFGNVWLDLGREVFIHGSPLGGADLRRGCISLSPRDADDVYGILSVGSTVRILR